MKRFAALLIPLILTGCLPFQPAKETARFVRLTVEPPPDTREVLYPAPIISATAPGYLDQSTVWYSDRDGRLTAINDYLWAENLPDSVRRGLTLLLAQEKPFPKAVRVDLQIDRFLLLDDGSGQALVEAVVTTANSVQALPIIRIDSAGIWDPANPGSFLAGYQSLLEETGKKLKTLIASFIQTT